MRDNTTWDKAAELVTGEDFFHRHHRAIFAALQRLAHTGRPLDTVTLADDLERRGELEEAGGLAYLGTIANDTPSAANVGAFRHRSRALHPTPAHRPGVVVADLGHEPEGRQADELLSEPGKQLSDLATKSMRGTGVVQISAAMRETMAEIDAAHTRADGLIGLSTGFEDLDGMTAGLQAGELIVLGGRPAMGKTALALNIAHHAASAAGRPVVSSRWRCPARNWSSACCPPSCDWNMTRYDGVR